MPPHLPRLPRPRATTRRRPRAARPVPDRATSRSCRPARRRTRRSSSGTSRSSARSTSRAAGRGRSSARCRARTVTVDIHCVTKWSKLDTVWEGVSVDTLLDGVETAAEYVVQFCDGGYTTNLPLEDVTGGKAWVAFGYDGEPLEPEHGGPARLLVPAPLLLEERQVGARPALSTTDEPGFWESTATTTTATHGRSSGTGATELAGRGRSSTSSPRRRASGRSCSTCPDWPGHRAGPARRRPPHRRGRLPGAAQLLDRLGAGRHSHRAHRRAARRRRGVALPDRRAPAGRRDRAARPDRRLLRLGAVDRRAAAARRRRLGRRAADGDAPRRAAAAGSDAETRAAPRPRAAGTTSSTATSSSGSTATASASCTP